MKPIRLSFSAFILFLIAPFVALAQQSVDMHANLPFDTSVRTGKLLNGLTYYVRHNGYPKNRAEMRLVIHAGSVLEDDDQQGLAHFNEHMCFNGTVNFPHNTLETFLEEHGARFGADLNAYTSFDETVYKESLPTDQGGILDSGIDILGEWAHNVTFDSTEFEKERGVVGEEWRLGRGAFERIYQKQAPIIFAGSKYASRNPIGLKPVIDTAHRSSILRFYHDWYRPDLMAVVVVGDFDPDQMVEKIKSKFSPLTNPANERPRTEFQIPPHSESYVAVNTDKEMPQTIFSADFVRPKEDEVTVADYRKHLVVAMYDQMLNARIQEAIQKGEAPFAYGGAGDGGFIGNYQAYSIFALLRADSIDAGVKSILKEVYRAKQTGFTESELDRAKKSMLSSIEKTWKEREKTKSINFTEEYVRNFLEKEPSPGIDYEYNLYKLYVPGISLTEVNALTPKLMDNASPVMTFSGPESADITPPSKDALLAIMNDVRTEHYAAYDDKAANQPLIAKAPKAGTVTSEKEIKPVGVTIWQLSNGAKVILKPTDFKDDEILFYATAPGGSSIAPEAEYLSAQMGDNIVESSGLSSFDAPTITKMLAGKEVEVSPYVSQIQQGLSGHSTKKDLETMFQLSYLYMTEPRYDSTASAVFIARQKGMLKNMGKMPEITYQDTMQYTLSQYNFRERPQTPELLDEVNFTKAYDYYKKLFGDASGFTFYFVGNIDPKTLKPMVEKYLASLPSTHSNINWQDLGIYPPKGTVVKKIYKGQDPKSIVSIVFHGKKPFSRENRFKLSTMCQAFEIKLREDIREDKSGVYYVSVAPNFQKKPHDGYRITINFGCDPKRVDELVGEVMKQLDTLTMRPMEATYIERVKNIGKNELEVNMRDNRYWMSQLRDRDWNDMDLETIAKSGELFDSLTPQEVFETAKEYFDRNNCAQFILYPEKKS